MFNEAQNFAIVQTELDTVFFQEFEYDAASPDIATAQTASLFKPVQTEHAAYIEETFKGSGLFSVISESAAVPASTPRVANKLTTLVKDFAQKIEISKDLFDDNMHSVWARTVRDFAMKARISQDDNAFALWRGAFTTTLTADGSALISTHTLIGGGTQSNLVSGALSPTTLNTALIALREQKDQAGVIMGNQPAILLVPTALWKKAVEVTDSALIADSANNNINVYRSAMGMIVLTSPYLGAASGGSDTAWFLLSRNHCVSRLIRQGIQTFLRDWGYSDNRSYVYQANFRESVFVADYVGVVGALGT